MFGGKSRNDHLSNIIAKFDETNKWSKLGNLYRPRSNHRVVHDGISFLVVGGDQNSVERCLIDNTGESISCTDKLNDGLEKVYTSYLGVLDKIYTPHFTNFINPALFLVDRSLIDDQTHNMLNKRTHNYM